MFLADIHPSQQGILSQQVLGQKSLQFCTQTKKNKKTKSHISSFSDKKVALRFGNLHMFHAVTAYSLLDWPHVSMCRCYDRRWQDLSDLLLVKHNCALNRAPASLEKWQQKNDFYTTFSLMKDGDNTWHTWKTYLSVMDAFSLQRTILSNVWRSYFTYIHGLCISHTTH